MYNHNYVFVYLIGLEDRNILKHASDNPQITVKSVSSTSLH